MKRHLNRLLQAESKEIPWARMALCAFATGMPLLLGLARQEAAYAIFGALCGYLLSLNDHFGRLQHRLVVITWTFALMIGGFVAGVTLQGHDQAFQIFLITLVYWLGVLSGDGGELERGSIFALVGSVIAHASSRFGHESLWPVLLFSGSGYLSLIVGALSLHLFWPQTATQPHALLLESFRKSMTWKREKHIHAACYALMTILSLWLSEHYSIERGYWIPVTVLLIMKPDRSHSILVTLQRLVGTVAGVLLTSLAVGALQSVAVYSGLAIACAFAIPWAGRRNYLVQTFFVTVMVIGLLEIVSPEHSDSHIPWVRLYATLIGCGLSILGSGLSKLLETISSAFEPWRRRLF